ADYSLDLESAHQAAPHSPVMALPIPPPSTQVTLSVTMLGFGTEVVGATSQPLPVTVTNSGTATLSVTSITVSANFGEMHDCGPMLAAGTSCTINVTFAPAAAASLNGMVTVADNATGSPQTVIL